MERIASFSKNHDNIEPDLSISMQMQGTTTFDLRFKKPNTVFIENKALHTIEHLMATLLRNSKEKENIIYFGPMGCRTGFYLITVNLDYEQVKNLLIECFEKVSSFDVIPGCQKEECGNYLEHDLDLAKKECEEYLKVLKRI